MAPDHLTIGEFTRWAESIDKKLDTANEQIEKVRDAVSDHSSRLAVLEDRARRNTRTKRLSWSAIATSIGAIIVEGFRYLNK